MLQVMLLEAQKTIILRAPLMGSLKGVFCTVRGSH
ncbi:hypothetical protein N665_1075s0015 [Sinapis alba]|nr:hypothetical protein N665_1075s0015 [Sinapis alba]